MVTEFCIPFTQKLSEQSNNNGSHLYSAFMDTYSASHGAGWRKCGQSVPTASLSPADIHSYLCTSVTDSGGKVGEMAEKVEKKCSTLQFKHLNTRLLNENQDSE